MLLLRRPDAPRTGRFLVAQAPLPFSYPSVGGTGTETFPPGYVVDRNRALLGRGDAVWTRAVSALLDWTMFQFDWGQLTPARPAVTPGTTVAVSFHHYGIWSLNAARIVYAIDEPRRRGFAYGTLPGHSESGEERFLVEQTETGEVYYDLLAFSRPRDLLARLLKPLARSLQHRFVLDSQRAMRDAVK